MHGGERQIARRDEKVRVAGYGEVDEPVVFGDPELGALLASALGTTSEVDRATHGFHTYPAGLHPDAARLLVRGLGGTSLLDPFVGGGTTLIEGRMAGLRTYGCDVSPVALMVAKARTTTLSDELLTRFRSAGRAAAEVARTSREPVPEEIRAAVEEWYAPHAAMELASLRASVDEADASVRHLLRVCLSSIVIKVSWRRSDTSGQRVKHKRPPGTTAVLFHKKVRELARRIVALREEVPEGTPPTQLKRHDARSITVPRPVDLVVTSPPYPSTYDYLALQHLRRIWLGLPLGEGEIGARAQWRAGDRRARRQWRADTLAWTAQVAQALAPGGRLVVVIGDGITPSGTVDTSEPTETAGREAGLELVARASVERVDHARESTRWEHAFLFRKQNPTA